MNQRAAMLEYEKLKEEQLQRIVTRDNCVYLNLVAIGAIMTYSFSAESSLEDRVSLLPISMLLVQFSSLALGWNHLMNDLKVSDIGKYIREVLTPILTDGRASAFEWEYFHTDDSLRKLRKITQTTIDLLVFFVPATLPFFWMLLGMPLPEPLSTSGLSEAVVRATRAVLPFSAVLFSVALAYLLQLFAYSVYMPHLTKRK